MELQHAFGATEPHSTETGIILRQRLQRLYTDHSPDQLRAASQMIEPFLTPIVDLFYNEILTIRETHSILQHSLVHKNLKSHLRHWISELLNPATAAQIDQLIEHQSRIGTVHANVNVRFEQFMYAFGVLKQMIFEQLYRHANTTDFGSTALAINQITDLLAALIGASYFEHEFEYETNEFSLRFKGLHKGAAIDCERLRSSLLDWLRSTLNLLYQTQQIQLETLPRLQQSNVGLWVVYKADLLSPFNNVQQELNEQIHAIDRALLDAARYRNERQEQAFLAAIVQLNDLVSKTSWYLATLVDDLIELDSGLDPLTRLFNRRYLDTVLRRQTDIARRTQLSFAVIIIDLDYFKAINDTYGHPAGDSVLRQFAEILLINIRTADFAFRYGGEEFVAVIGDATMHTAMALAERIRLQCSNHRFLIAADQHITITCSSGVAVFDGHPDPLRTLNQADQALYRAKHNGRNRCELFTAEADQTE